MSLFPFYYDTHTHYHFFSFFPFNPPPCLPPHPPDSFSIFSMHLHFLSLSLSVCLCLSLFDAVIFGETSSLTWSGTYVINAMAMITVMKIQCKQCMLAVALRMGRKNKAHRKTGELRNHFKIKYFLLFLREIGMCVCLFLCVCLSLCVCVCHLWLLLPHRMHCDVTVHFGT